MRGWGQRLTVDYGRRDNEQGTMVAGDERREATTLLEGGERE